MMLAVAMVLASMTMGVANARDWKTNDGKEPFMVRFSQLSAYLGLAPSQMEEVHEINDLFKRQQRESMGKGIERRDDGLRKAIYGNLKLMKGVLAPQQYRKYVTLLNVTNNNNRLIGATAIEGSYLAENK